MDMNVKLNLSYPAIPAKDSQPGKLSEPSANTAPDEIKKPERAEVVQAVKDIQAFVQASQRQIEFSVDESTGTIVVKVIATQSGEVVRQLPSEEALKLAQSLTTASSLLFDTQA